MKVTAISDLHGTFPKLDGGDLLLLGGDYTGWDRVEEYEGFFKWVYQQDYDKKIFIAGNHDKQAMSQFDWYGAEYLYDTGTKYRGLKIHGSPWTRWFEGINPNCDAYTLKTEEELATKYALIPDEVDILLTHGPQFGIKDHTWDKRRVGSVALMEKMEKIKVRYHIFGHIHEAYGTSIARGYLSLNVSQMDRSYEPVNKAVNFEIEVS